MSPATIIMRLFLGSALNVGALVLLGMHAWLWGDVAAGVASVAGMGFAGWMVLPDHGDTAQLIADFKALAEQD